jgi:RNA polymerase sigma factor FliA
MSIGTIAAQQRLSSPEAEQLWLRWKDGRDLRSRDRLVLAYAPMVRYIASRKVRELPAHCELDDLASAGLVALMEAIDRFDPARGASFEQYAWTRVAGALVD